MSIAGTPARCRACRDFAARNQPGQCRWCRRLLPVNRFGQCRLCGATRRFPAVGEDATHGGPVQLFFGDLEYPRRRSAPPPNEAPAADPVADTATWAQPALFEMFPEPRHAAAAAKSWRATQTGQGLLAELTAFAESHGWSTATTQTTSRALTLLAAVGGLRPDPPVVPAGLAAELRRRHLPLTRLIEFLTDSTGAEPISVEPTAKSWTDDAALADLPPAMRQEIELWLDVLAGNTTRTRPHADTTIAAYLRAVLPAVRAWAQEHTSLREVTTEEITGWVESMSGSTRVGTLVGLRSLFTALKSRRAVFTNPARSVRPGRFPRRPVLGLDPLTRSGLLARTDRADHGLVMLLAGVHALTRAHIAAVCLDDVDLHKRRLHVPGRTIALDDLTHQHLRRWLNERRTRWPATSNPHLLLTAKSAYGTGRVSNQYFRALPIAVSRLRADRLLVAAEDSDGDPLAIQRLFGVDPSTAVRYCTELSAVEGHDRDLAYAASREPGSERNGPGR